MLDGHRKLQLQQGREFSLKQPSCEKSSTQSPMARRVPVVESRATQNGNSTASPARAAAAAAAGAGTTRAAFVTPTKNSGILHPPPDVRCIVDKTAEFVAQNGVEFEQKILSNEKRNPRFNFLKSKDAYHSYYQHRILEFIDQGQSVSSGNSKEQSK